jgi:hypothetical protein
MFRIKEIWIFLLKCWVKIVVGGYLLKICFLTIIVGVRVLIEVILKAQFFMHDKGKVKIYIGICGLLMKK